VKTTILGRSQLTLANAVHAAFVGARQASHVDDRLSAADVPLGVH
jgi:hypothetical protein